MGLTEKISPNNENRPNCLLGFFDNPESRAYSRMKIMPDLDLFKLPLEAFNSLYNYLKNICYKK